MIPIRKIAVIGGTGKAGKYLINHLLEKGYHIKALARNPDNLVPSNPNLERISGNARSYYSIYQVLEGCDALISTLGPDRSDPDTCSIAVGHIIQVMQVLKIKRYIEVAGLAINTPEDMKGFRTRLLTGLMKRFAADVISDRQKSYTLLKASGIEWTIVRCPIIKFTGSAGQVITSLTDSPGLKINAADLAVFLVQQLTDEKFVNKAPFVSN